MDNLKQRILDIVNSATPEESFLAGIYFLGALVFIYIILRVGFRLLFRRKKRCNGIKINSDKGQLYIMTNAISELIKSMKSTFTHIEINKVSLTYKRGSYMLDLLITFDMDGGELTNQITLLREKIISDLQTVFGIDNISKINVKLKKTTRSRGKQSTQPTLNPADAKVFTSTGSDCADTIKMEDNQDSNLEKNNNTPK